MGTNQLNQSVLNVNVGDAGLVSLNISCVQPRLAMYAWDINGAKVIIRT